MQFIIRTKKFVKFFYQKLLCVSMGHGPDQCLAFFVAIYDCAGEQTAM